MAKKQSETAEPFVNPFEPGVNYETFLKAKGDLSVAEYCKGNLTPEQIKWLENDLTHYKK